MSVDTKFLLPLFEGLKAGFPSPAADYIDVAIDLNKELIKHPASTFLGRVSGDSMKDANLDDGDLLVIDKSIRPAHGMMAVCFLDGEFTIKYIKIDGENILLVPANDAYDPILVTQDDNFVVWGIVTSIIKKPKELDDVRAG
ncbi:MAG: translesion error-prone DNA polymerase V autoproteolytic subunit [Bacteroidales bacterium]|nr:translesion error-prone DNA polymerase V autoproteolytic subunit [Bacteroidales bacterium]